MGWLQTLAAETVITLSAGTFWLSVGQALLFGIVCLLVGIWVARQVGLLESNAPAGETVGVGLAAGLMVLAAWWAALASGGRSSFTPVAGGFAIAIAIAVVRREKTPADIESQVASPEVAGVATASRWSRHKPLILAALAGAAFIAAVALLYGSTMALSPRDGVQPLEFMDEAFYSILGADLAKTGTETIYSPSGFSALQGLPPQTWYHWGELWLASAVITIFGAEPLLARHFIVLPVLLLAAAALTGTLVHRLTGTSSRGAYLFGCFACLFLAPVPLIPGPFFSSWAVGLIFGITMYGLAAVAVLFAMYSIAVLGTRRATWTLTGFVGSAVAMIVPAHVIVALLALVGAGSVWTIRILWSLVATRGLPIVSSVWRRAFMATGIAIVVTVAWGLLTGHGVGTSGLSTSVSPFNASWRDSVAITILGAGAFFGIPVAWLLIRKEAPIQANMFVGTTALLVVGVVAWGARLGDFTMFHVFFAGIAVFATPVAAFAVWSVWIRLRATGHARLALAALLLAIGQMEFGVGLGIIRLQSFGPHDYAPIPIALLNAVERLPPDAKIAYACNPLEEIGFFWDPRLLSINAHTGRRIVAMCFQAEAFGDLNGTARSREIASPQFAWAPQRTIYPNSLARPSSAVVAAFMKEHGISYIFEDNAHRNSLVSDTIPVMISGDAQILRVP